MMSNFGFLRTKKEYELFAPACAEAEKIYASAHVRCWLPKGAGAGG